MLDLREVRCEGVDWIHLAQDRDQWRAVVKTEKTSWLHKRRTISLLANRTVSFSRTTLLHAMSYSRNALLPRRSGLHPLKISQIPFQTKMAVFWVIAPWEPQILHISDVICAMVIQILIHSDKLFEDVADSPSDILYTTYCYVRHFPQIEVYLVHTTFREWLYSPIHGIGCHYADRSDITSAVSVPTAVTNVTSNTFMFVLWPYCSSRANYWNVVNTKKISDNGHCPIYQPFRQTITEFHFTNEKLLWIVNR
jgi:hypothetical protein